MAAFNGDNLIAAEVLRLRDKHGLKVAVETGTYHGDTTAWLCENFQHVRSVESNREALELAMTKLERYANLRVERADSRDWLRALLAEPMPGKCLFFLDAHWGADWPLLGELTEIWCAEMRDVVIVIHDFQVPGTDFGFDEYGGQPLNLSYVLPKLDAIYGPGMWQYHYNDQAEGARRGVIYVEPA